MPKVGEACSDACWPVWVWPADDLTDCPSKEGGVTGLTGRGWGGVRTFLVHVCR